MRKWILATALVFTWKPCSALISVMEALPSTRDAIYVGTTTPQVLLNGGTFYSGTVPSVSLYVASNTVLGNCVAYATGSIMCLGVRLSTGDPVGAYVPYTGATSNVNLGAKTLTTTGNIQVGQVGAGTSASSNFYFDGLSASGGGYVRIGAGTNQATGYYWGGTRGYSMQERYDLTGTPFTLHDELNNVDRFSLGVSGDWYFPYGVTTDSFTSLGAIKGAGTGLTGTGASFTAGKATALAAAGTTAPSGQLSRGVDPSGNNLNANVDATVIGASTNPIQGGAVSTALALRVAKIGDTMTGALTVNAPGASITASGGVVGSSGSFTNGLTASSGTFLQTSTFSVTSASGVYVAAGDIDARNGCIRLKTGDVCGPGAGSGDTTNTGTPAMTSTPTWTGGGLSISMTTTCTGLGCRVGYSSGTANSFSFVLQASTVYNMSWIATVSSGTSSVFTPFVCTINGDTTVAHYAISLFGYPNPYNVNGSNLLALGACGTSAVNTNDFSQGVMHFVGSRGSILLSWSAVLTQTCQSLGVSQTEFTGGYNQSNAGPWTVTCHPTGTQGWDHEAILYQVGK